MSKTGKVILFISLVLNLLLGYLLCNKPVPTSSNPEQYIEKINSLELELDSIREHRDKVREEIDTVYIQLETVKIEYVETRNRVVNNSPSDDYRFFIEYLDRARHNSFDHF